MKKKAKSAKIARKPPEKRKSERLFVQLEPRRKDRYQRAADDMEIDLSDWIRRSLDRSAKEQGIE